MERINQLGSNQLKKGEVYSFEVKSKNLQGENLILLKLNQEYYTVELLKNQKIQDIPKSLKCKVKNIEKGVVVLVQKKNKKALFFILLLLALVFIGGIIFMYQKDLKGFEEDLDNESTMVEVEKPVIEEKTIEFKVNSLGGSTKSIEDMTKAEYQNFLKSKKASSSSEPILCLDENTFNKFLEDSGQINPTGIKFNKKEYVLDASKKAFIRNLVEICNSTKRKGVFNISGLTCDLGMDKFNMDLSKDRAFAVKEFLETLDLKENLIKTNFYGESKFKAVGDIEECRVLNRLAIISYEVLD